VSTRGLPLGQPRRRCRRSMICTARSKRSRRARGSAARIVQHTGGPPAPRQSSTGVQSLQGV